MSYVSVYLKEEVWAEQLVRSMEPFRRFLEVAAQCFGKILNLRNIARDTGIDPKTAANWFSVLEDTLVGFYLDSYDTSIRRQMRKAAKFFLFDVGVTRALSGMLSHEPAEATSYYGELFEQFLIAQIHAKNIYLQLDYQLSYLQTKAGLEIDLIIQRPGKSLLLVEIKSKSKIDDRDIRHLEKLQTDFKGAEFVLLSRDAVSKKFGNITCLHYLSFLEQLGVK